jgi:hypothetical protein
MGRKTQKMTLTGKKSYTCDDASIAGEAGARPEGPSPDISFFKELRTKKY